MELSRLNRIYNAWTKIWWPPIMVGLLLFVVLISVWRWYLFTPLECGGVCTEVYADQAVPQSRSLGEEFQFHTRDPCFSTGIDLKQGRDYKITLTVKEPWFDGGIKADPGKLRWKDITWTRLQMKASSLPARRFWNQGWFVMMGSIGRDREHAFRIAVQPVKGKSDTYTYTFHAWRSGRFYLFVNDAVNAFDSRSLCLSGYDSKGSPWRCYYDNNTGDATVKIENASECCIRR